MQNLSCKNEFYLNENNKSFHINSFAPSLPLKQRLEHRGNGLLYTTSSFQNEQRNDTAIRNASAVSAWMIVVFGIQVL